MIIQDKHSMINILCVAEAVNWSCYFHSLQLHRVDTDQDAAFNQLQNASRRLSLSPRWWLTHEHKYGVKDVCVARKWVSFMYIPIVKPE